MTGPAGQRRPPGAAARWRLDRPAPDLSGAAMV